MARFGRIVTAMVTPYTSEGAVDLDEAQRLARYLVDHGSEGILVCGSTGESPVLSDGEKVELVRAVSDAVSGAAKVLAGTGTYDTHHSIELTRRAEKLGVDGVLVVTPYYNKPPQDALLEHFRAVADATSVPLMLYDIPGRTATQIATETLLRAAEHPNIVAVKQASSDFSSSVDFAAEKPDDFEIYSGNDHETLLFQALGAVGVVSVASHVCGERIRDQFDAFERGDVAAARAVHEMLVPVYRAIFCTSNPIPVKAAMELLGFSVGPARAPLRPASAAERDRVRSAMEAAALL